MNSWIKVAALTITALPALSSPLHAQTGQLPAAPAAQPVSLSKAVTVAAPSIPLNLPHSSNPLDAYRAAHVPAPDLANSSRIDTLVHDGVLELSLKDAIDLALEDNLDLAIARYNIPIAKADVLRTQAGGTFLGVNTGVVQNTPGGGVGGFGSASSGAGAGGTTGGQGGAGAGASGLVQSTPSVAAPSSHPTIPLSPETSATRTAPPPSPAMSSTASHSPHRRLPGHPQLHPGLRHRNQPRRRLQLRPRHLQQPQHLPHPGARQLFQAEVRQHLLSGFGFGPNLRYLHIARNNQKISDQAFELQVISTVTQIANIYWDLVAATRMSRSRPALSSSPSTPSTLAANSLTSRPSPPSTSPRTRPKSPAASRTSPSPAPSSSSNPSSSRTPSPRTSTTPSSRPCPSAPTDLSTVNIDPTTAAASSSSSNATDDLVQQALAHRLELSESGIDLQTARSAATLSATISSPRSISSASTRRTGLAGVNNPLSQTPPPSQPPTAALHQHLQ